MSSCAVGLFFAIKKTPDVSLSNLWTEYGLSSLKISLFAKISMRLVPNQKSEKITKLFSEHFKSIAPSCVNVKVTPHHGGEAYVSPTNDIGYNAAKLAMTDSFGKAPIPVRTGGSIPIVSLFEKELGLKSILMGFGLDSDAIHSPNEHYGVFNFLKGIETIPLFFKYFNELKSDT